VLLEAFAVFVMLGILSVLIIVHETGHYSVARLFGFQTPVFGFGLPFGPYWVMGSRWGTQFRVHALMLGGYVAIPELGDESAANEENFGVPLAPFRKFPIWQRAIVAFAGVGFNILFAYLIMFGMYASLGQPSQAVVVERLPKENPIAAQAGVQVGDRLLSVDDCQISTPDDVVTYLGKLPHTAIVLHVERKGAKVDIPAVTNGMGKVGMALIAKGPVTYQKLQGNLLEIAGIAWNKMCKLTWSMLEATGMVFQGLFHGGEQGARGHPAVGLEDLHGVLAVVKIGADIARQDWSQLLLFTIMISLDLAIINLLPWPALDGGHLAFMALEAVRGRPMGERAQGEIVKWGFISLLVLMAVIMVNDVRALFTGELDLKPRTDKPGAAQPGTAKPTAPPPGAAEPGTAKPTTPQPGAPQVPQR
jgi:regulator of sigma E protease